MDTVNTKEIELFLQPYLPTPQSKLFITATWAQSLDARIAAGPDERTRLSGIYTKKMTHFLRTKHDAILVGKDTLQTDDPQLNSRYSADCKSPIPIILDSKLSTPITTEQDYKVLINAKRNYKAPWFIVDTNEIDPLKVGIIKDLGGRIVEVQNTRDWNEISEKLQSLGIESLMVEGGAKILDSCLRSNLVNHVIITIAPLFLGRHGVEVSPMRSIELGNVKWWNNNDVEDSVVVGVPQYI